MTNHKRSVREQPRKNNALKNDDEDERTIGKVESKANSQQILYQFVLNRDIKKSKPKPISEEYGKTVYEVEWTNGDGPPIVLLQIDGAKAIEEASFYVQLSCHPHIINTYGLVQSNLASTMLLQERAPQGNLSELLRADEFIPNEEVLWEIFKQICDAMLFLVGKKIIHGDLACRNVLVFQMNPLNPQKNLVKLTDFGLINNNKLYSLVDTPGSSALTNIHMRYAAPELLQNLNRLKYSEMSDIYSMGILMWEACANGQLPYTNINDSEIIRREKLTDNRLPRPSSCSDQLWNIIDQCWEIDPKQPSEFKSLKISILDLQSQSIENSERETTPKTNADLTVIPLKINKFEDFEASTREESDLERSFNKNEHFYSNQASSDSNEAGSSPSGSTACPFCQLQLPSSEDLRVHLIQCGTKTDQCPNCRQFIQRAVFAYHYENNCTDINEGGIGRKANNSHSAQTAPHNSNQRNGNAAELDYCVRNSANRNNTSPRKTGLTYFSQMPSSHGHSQIDNGSSLDADVLIPCEYCQNPYPKDQLYQHEKSCRTSSPNNRRDGRVPPVNGTAYPTADQYGEHEDEHGCCCCS